MFEKYSDSFLKDFDIQKKLSEVTRKFISLNKSSLIYTEHDRVRYVYFILSGKVEMRKLINERNESLGCIGPGGLIGVEDALTGDYYGKTIYTLEETDLILVRKNDFMILLALDNDFRHWILKYLCLRINSRS
ncbi:MAG: cyclic nucleotide-binding domain-containing protein [Ignavibacteria bacterium]